MQIPQVFAISMYLVRIKVPDGPYAAVIPLFMQAVLDHKSPFIDGDGEQTRDFTFVENAVQANICAILLRNANAMNEVYNVAVGEKHP